MMEVGPPQAALSAFTWGRSGSSISRPSHKSNRCGQWRPLLGVVQGSLRGSWAGRRGHQLGALLAGGAEVFGLRSPQRTQSVQWAGDECAVREGAETTPRPGLEWSPKEGKEPQEQLGPDGQAKQGVEPTGRDKDRMLSAQAVPRLQGSGGEAGGQGLRGRWAFGQGRWRALSVRWA